MLGRALAVAAMCASLLVAQSRYTISTIAGTMGNGDGAPAVDATLRFVSSFSTDQAGNLFIADQNADLIREVSAHGILSTYAGGGPTGAFNISGIPALGAFLFQPTHLTSDGQGNLYFAELGTYTVRRINAQGILETVAGNGQPLFPYWPVGNNVSATSVRLGGALSIHPEASGAFLFEEAPVTLGGPERIRQVSSNDIITTVLSNVSDFTGVSCFEPSGDLLVANGNGTQIIRVTMKGATTVIAGTGGLGFSGDYGPAINATFGGISALAEGTDGTIYIADGGNFRIRKIANKIVQTIAGTGAYPHAPAENVPATSVAIADPQSIGVAADRTVYFSETFGSSQRVRRISPDGMLSTVAGNQGVYDTPPSTSIAMFPLGGVAVDSQGDVYFADKGASCVRKWTPNGLLTTVAGSGFGSSAQLVVGASGPATKTAISTPLSVALDSHGNLIIIATYGAYRLDANKTLTVVASFSTSSVSDIVTRGTIDRLGNLYVVTSSGVQKIAPGGSRVALTHDPAVDVAFDNSGNLYIGEPYQVVKVTPNGKSMTFAGTGVSGTAHETGPALSTQFSSVAGIAVDSHDNVYVSDGPKIRLITTDGLIRTIAAPAPAGYSVDGGTAAASAFLTPQALAVDAEGDVYFSNTSSGGATSLVRRLTPAHHTVDAQIQSIPLDPNGAQGSMYATVGTVSAVLNDAQTELILTVTQDVPNATAIRVRRGTPASPGAIVYTFAHTFSPAVAIWQINASDLAAFLVGKLYVEVESSTITDAEIAGQLVPAPRLWVTGNTTNTLGSIDTVTMAIVDIAPTGKDPFGVGLSADGSSVYVTAYSSNELTVFDSATMTSLATIATPPAPTLTALLPDGSGLLVTDNLGSELSIINFASNSVVASAAVGLNPIGVAVSPDGKLAYVANQGSSNLSIVDLATKTVSQTVTLGGVPWGVAGSPDGSHMYVCTQTPSVEVVDTASAKVVASIALGNEPYPRGIIVGGDGKFAYVAGSYSNQVFVVDLTANAVAGTIPVASPQALALSADGSRLYAAAIYAAVLTVIDTKSNKVIATSGLLDTANWIAVR
jgi:YVTN family beta-propeller protein